ncbi:hypothetical protein [Bacillus sp. Marseille-P3800]|uniref:hypothetical protein n=1 Tax=Bacillus sp. Marseille-P3800 TaxID=2014782 RepID=UPI000C080055|nr:hypothetical protein [Bacillus sp. Marseille-P3800]
MTKTYTRRENQFFMVEGWLWIFIFLLSISYSLLRIFQVQPWLNILFYSIATLVVSGLITKVIKMNAFRRPKRALLYGVLTILTLVFFFLPWQSLLF